MEVGHAQRQAPEITVVIPSYNRAHLIGQTLDAVLSQTLPADEVIVVDDGSDDDTQTVLADYGDRIRPIRIANSGELVARNTGLRAAKGLLVAFCDSDDLWMNDFLAVMSAQWRNTPDLVACYADFRVLQDEVLSECSKFDAAPAAFWSGLRPTGSDSGVFDQPITDRLLTFQPLFPSCMMVLRSAFLALGGWDEGVSRSVGCDFATTLRVAASPPLGVCRRPLVAIRKHASNFSGDTEKMNLGDAFVLEHVLRTRPELTYLASAIRDSIGQRRRDALDSAFLRHDFPSVRKIYHMLPLKGRPLKSRAKRAIASLPSPFNVFAASLTTRSTGYRQNQ